MDKDESLKKLDTEENILKSENESTVLNRSNGKLSVEEKSRMYHSKIYKPILRFQKKPWKIICLVIFE